MGGGVGRNWCSGGGVVCVCVSVRGGGAVDGRCRPEVAFFCCRRLYTRNIGASLTGTNKIGNRTGEPF